MQGVLGGIKVLGCGEGGGVRGYLLDRSQLGENPISKMASKYKGLSFNWKHLYPIC